MTFSSQSGAQSTEPHQPGPLSVVFAAILFPVPPMSSALETGTKWVLGKKKAEQMGGSMSFNVISSFLGMKEKFRCLKCGIFQIGWNHFPYFTCDLTVLRTQVS